MVDFATVESHLLAAVGSGSPVVEVNLRYYEYPGPKMVYKHDLPWLPSTTRGSWPPC